MTCPTCGSPVEEEWPDGHHRFAFGPEASACGRCGRDRGAEVHRPHYRPLTGAQLPTVDQLAQALHEAADPPCASNHAAAGREGLEAIHYHHRRQAQSILTRIAERAR